MRIWSAEPPENTARVLHKHSRSVTRFTWKKHDHKCLWFKCSLLKNAFKYLRFKQILATHSVFKYSLLKQTLATHSLFKYSLFKQTRATHALLKYSLFKQTLTTHELFKYSIFIQTLATHTLFKYSLFKPHSRLMHYLNTHYSNNTHDSWTI